MQVKAGDKYNTLFPTNKLPGMLFSEQAEEAAVKSDRPAIIK